MSRYTTQILYAALVSFTISAAVCLQCYMTSVKVLLVTLTAVSATVITAVKCYRIKTENTTEPATAGQRK